MSQTRAQLRNAGYGSDDDPATRLSPEALTAARDQQLAQIAAGLGVGPEWRGPQEVRSAIGLALQHQDLACLWVVDDLPSGLDSPTFGTWLAPHPLAATLLTTRSRTYTDLARTVELDVLADHEAYVLLTSYRAPADDPERQAARRLAVQDLGGHALAITVAGADLARQGSLGSFADYRAALAVSDHDVLEQAVADDLVGALPSGHAASIARTLLRSIRQLDPDGTDVLRLASVLATAPIPERLLADVLAQADGTDEPTARRRAIRGLAHAEDRSLVIRITTTSATPPTATPPPAPGSTVLATLPARATLPPRGDWIVHVLVARTMRRADPNPDRSSRLQEAAITVITERFAAAAEDARQHSQLHDLVPHARELVTISLSNPDHARTPNVPAVTHATPDDAATVATDQELSLLFGLARYDYERGDYSSAKELYQATEATSRRIRGDDHPDTLAAMGNVAATLGALGEHAAARDLQQQVLAGSRRVLGDDHPDTSAKYTDSDRSDPE